MLRDKDEQTHIYLLLLKISYFLFLTYSLLGHISYFKIPLKYATFVALGLLIVNFLLQYNHAHKKEFLMYVFLVVVALIHSYCCENYGFLKLMMFAGSVRKVDFKHIVKFDMQLRFFLIILLVLLCQIGIAPDITMTYDGVVRHSLGFTNPNALGIAVFILACDMFYVYKMRMNWWRVSFLSLLSLWLFWAARSRTAVYGILFLLIMAIVYTLYPKLYERPVIKVIFYIAPFALAFLTLCVVNAFMDNSSWALELNELLSGRVKAIANFARLLSPKFFGQPISETLDHSLDNTYAFVWLDLGIVVTFFFMFAYVKLIKRNYKNENIPLCIIFFTFMLYGLSEHLWINVDYNVFMLALFYDAGNFVQKVPTDQSGGSVTGRSGYRYYRANG